MAVPGISISNRATLGLEQVLKKQLPARGLEVVRQAITRPDKKIDAVARRQIRATGFRPHADRREVATHTYTFMSSWRATVLPSAIRSS